MQEAPAQPLRNGIAIISLVLGILSLFTCGLLGIGALVGLGLGIFALIQANKKPTEYGGSGLAVGGILTSGLGAVLFVAVIVAIPQLNRGLKKAREVGAMTTLTTMHEAEGTYYRRFNKFGTLRELADEGLIDTEIGRGRTSFGYVYSLSALTENSFCLHATRANASDARQDFNIATDGKVHSRAAPSPSLLPCGEGTIVLDLDKN
ncbi:MAG: DUF4190 domain-containing protein [Blastocatellia bacterium]